MRYPIHVPGPIFNELRRFVQSGVQHAAPKGSGFKNQALDALLPFLPVCHLGEILVLNQQCKTLAGER